MPRHDPTPTSRQRKAEAWRRYRQLMKGMAGVAFLAVVLALLWLRRSGEDVPLGMILATIGGVGFSVLLGTALMGLVFLSNSSGYDDEAAQRDDDE